jgi:DNA mismatch repair protein MutS
MARTDRSNSDSELSLTPAVTSRDAGFRSILFGAADVDVGGAQHPEWFVDLNLDQVVDGIVARRDEYDLRPFFYRRLHEVDAVRYRHAVFRDLETADLRDAVDAFAGGMRRVRQYLVLVEKQRYVYEKERWFLDAAATYCAAIRAFVAALADIELSSAGFLALREYLIGYCSSQGFMSLASAAQIVGEGLARVRYTVRIRGARVTVQAYAGEDDYSVQAEQVFARFSQGAAESHLVKVPDSGSMDHVEAQIAKLVGRIYPAEFKALEEFCEHHDGFVDPSISRFDREVQFYVAYLDYTERLGAGGLPFCYPTVSATWSEVAVGDAFDIALAAKLGAGSSAVVCNDFALEGAERVLVVTGPNQGGKTTFARMVGQLHYLAGLGVPVPARRAQLLLVDQLFTLFGRQEDISTLRGRLDDELIRVKEILERATSQSLILLNEIFASTTVSDAVYLGSEVLRRIIELGCPAVCVTFVDELADLDEATVSMVAMVAPNDPSERTYEIMRRPADGRAYAWSIADKYGLSHGRLRSRIQR